MHTRLPGRFYYHILTFSCIIVQGCMLRARAHSHMPRFARRFVRARGAVDMAAHFATVKEGPRQRSLVAVADEAVCP